MTQVEIRDFFHAELSDHATEKEAVLNDLAVQLADAIGQQDDYIFIILNQLEEIQHILEVNLKGKVFQIKPTVVEICPNRVQLGPNKIQSDPKRVKTSNLI